MKNTLTVGLILSCAAAAGAVTPVEFDRHLAGVRLAVQESRDTGFDREVTRLIAVLRDNRDRAARIEALHSLENRFPGDTFIDQYRIVDAILNTMDDMDKGFRSFPILAAGRIAESADEGVAGRIAAALGQKIEETRLRTPFDGDGDREALFTAYSKTGGRVRTLSGRHAEQFIDGVLQELRERAMMTGDRGKTGAMSALNRYLGYAAYSLWSQRREVFDRMTQELVAAPQPQPTESELQYRAEYAKALVRLTARGETGPLMSDPSLRMKFKDRLERMYQDEVNPALKSYIGLRLGHRIIGF